MVEQSHGSRSSRELTSQTTSRGRGWMKMVFMSWQCWSLHEQPVYGGAVELAHIGVRGLSWLRLTRSLPQRHRISLHMVVNHHVLAEKWAQDLWKSSHTGNGRGFWNLKACHQRHTSSNKATSPNLSQILLSSIWGPSVWTDELMGAILIQTTTGSKPP